MSILGGIYLGMSTWRRRLGLAIIMAIIIMLGSVDIPPAGSTIIVLMHDIWLISVGISCQYGACMHCDDAL